MPTIKPNNLQRWDGKHSYSILKNKGFATHPTFTSTYGDLENQAFVEAIYRNALGRDGDAEGIAYWTDLVDRGMIRSDMVATFVELSMVTDLTPANYPSLSAAELAAAQLRQDLISNKVKVAVVFTKQLEELSNVENSDAPEQDPAYMASIQIISEVTEHTATVSAALGFLEGIKQSDDPIGQIIKEVKEDEITTPIDTSTLTASECTEKITNQNFFTNIWTTSLDEWNDVALACLPILAGISNDDTNMDNDSNTDTTSLSSMRTHPDDKLASSDCKSYIGGGGTVSLVWIGNTLETPIVPGINSWSDVQGALRSDLAPADNMMQSIESSQWIQTAVDTGQLTFDQAVDVVNRDKEPFSDSPSISGDSTITIPNTDTGNTQIPTEILTLAICETDYAGYTNSMWAQAQTSSDTAGKAAACYHALVAGPMYGIDGQLYIDQYNAGVYSY